MMPVGALPTDTTQTLKLRQVLIFFFSAEREHDNYFKELRDTEDSEEEVDSVNELEAQGETYQE